MNNMNIRDIIIREIVIIGACVGIAFGAVKFMPENGTRFLAVKLAGLLYIASIALRIAGFFIQLTFKVVFILAIIAVALVVLAARYPSLFHFLK
jgi:hypothetical protein